MRVLHIGKFYPPYKGGMETHLHTLCTQLRHMVDVSVVVSNTSRGRVDEIIDGVSVSRLGTLFNFGSAPVNPGLAAHIRGSGADIVHIHVPHPTAILAYLTSGHRGRLVVTYHSDIVRQRILGAAFAPIMHRALSRADAIICTSPNYVESSPTLRRHRSRCRVLPFSIETASIENVDPAATEQVRARYGERLLLSVGRQVSYKGFEFLVRAMPDVRGKLILVGNGPLRPELERVAKSLGVSERIVFLDGVADVAPYYHAADVFVLPSIARSEAFGLVQLEAMAAGKPVVNTAIASGVPYVSVDGLTGITVAPRDPPALASAVNRLLDDPVLSSRYGAAGRSRVETHFSAHEMVRQTVDLYREVLGGANDGHVKDAS